MHNKLIYTIYFGSHEAIWRRTRTALTLLHPAVKDCFDLPAGILGIPLVHHVQERQKVVAGAGLFAVHIVHDGDEPDAPLREEHLRVVADLQVVAAKPAHVFDNHHADMSGLYLCHHSPESWPVEVGSGVAVISEVTNVGESPLGGVVLQEFFLVCDAVALAGQFVIA